MAKIEEKVMAAFGTADEETRTYVMNLLGVDPRPVTETVKTMDDVMAELGESHPLVVTYSRYLESTDIEMRDRHLMAYLKLRMVAEALNEGWHPQFTEDEKRYYPWLWLHKDKESAERLAENDEYVFEIPDSLRAVLFGGNANYGAYAGFACSRSYNAPSNTYAYFGSRLCFKTRELVLHAASTFTELWLEWFCM